MGSLGADHRIRGAFEQLSNSTGVELVDTSNVRSITRDDVEVKVKVFDSDTFDASIKTLREYLLESIEAGEFLSFDQDDLNMFAHALAKLANFEESFALPFEIHQFANLTIYKYLKVNRGNDSNLPHSVASQDALDEMLVQQFAIGKYKSCESILKDIGETLNRELYLGRIDNFFTLRSLLAVAIKSRWIDAEKFVSMYDVTTQRISSLINSGKDVDKEFIEEFYCNGQMLRVALSAVDSETRKKLLSRIDVVNRTFVNDLNLSKQIIAEILKAELRGFVKSISISVPLSRTKTGAILEVAAQGAGRFEYEHRVFGHISNRSKLARQRLAIEAQKLNPKRLSSSELVGVAKDLFETEKVDHDANGLLEFEVARIVKDISRSENLVHDPSVNTLEVGSLGV